MCPLEKYGIARQATDDNIMRRTRIACWISTATDTHRQCVILIAFSTPEDNAPQCYVRTHIACLFPIYRDVDMSDNYSSLAVSVLHPV